MVIGCFYFLGKAFLYKDRTDCIISGIFSSMGICVALLKTNLKNFTFYKKIKTNRIIAEFFKNNYLSLTKEEKEYITEECSIPTVTQDSEVLYKIIKRLGLWYIKNRLSEFENKNPKCS